MKKHGSPIKIENAVGDIPPIVSRPVESQHSTELEAQAYLERKVEDALTALSLDVPRLVFELRAILGARVQSDPLFRALALQALGIGTGARRGAFSRLNHGAQRLAE
ncbi:hypothetical protein LZC95_08170 [Pendulispora brunnea]|uniref:Uncharacterized protein n=1 Tax=Pendulispora brunnea TaxID=2905690 RepID=A0ABZ2KDN4_9BACT